MTAQEIVDSAERIDSLLENYVTAAFFGDNPSKEQTTAELEANVYQLQDYLESLI